MTARRATSALPIRRGLGREDAAVYVGVSPSKFAQLVADGRAPQPRCIDARRVWDVDELDAWFKSLPRDGIDGEADTWADMESEGAPSPH